MLLAAQELVVAKLPLRLALCVTIIAVVALGAAMPWIAHSLAQQHARSAVPGAAVDRAARAVDLDLRAGRPARVRADDLGAQRAQLHHRVRRRGVRARCWPPAGWCWRCCPGWRQTVPGSDPHARAHGAHRADDAGRPPARRAMAPAPAQRRVLPEPDGRTRRSGQRRLGADAHRPRQARGTRQAGSGAAGARLRAGAAGAGGVRAAVAHRRRAERGQGGERGRVGRRRWHMAAATPGRAGRRGRERGIGRGRRQAGAAGGRTGARAGRRPRIRRRSK